MGAAAAWSVRARWALRRGVREGVVMLDAKAGDRVYTSGFRVLRARPEGGAADVALRSLLTPGAHPASLGTLRLVAEAAALPWAVRVHERSTMLYGVHLVVAEATLGPS